MKKILFFICLLCAPAVMAQGLPALPELPSFQAPEQGGDNIMQNPQCFVVRNMTENTVYGSISTNYFTNEDGVRARHRSNFQLPSLGSREMDTGHFTDRRQFCTTGPFYPGGKIALDLRTMFPVFSCHTRIDQGEILIKSSRRDGTYSLWAECFE